MLRRVLLSAFGFVLTGMLFLGCSKGPEEPQAGVVDGKDYRKMLQHARQRSSTERNRRLLDTSIRSFQHDLGRLPTNLYELVRTGYLEEIPPPPPNSAYRYSPVYGRVDLVALPQDQNQGQVPSPAVR